MLNRKPGKLIGILCLMLAVLILPQTGLMQTVEEMNQQIQAKQKEIDNLKNRISTYQANIRAKQTEAASLKNQMAILENEIAKTELDIQATTVEVSQTQLEIRNRELQILAKENAIDTQKGNLGEILQKIRQSDQENALKIFLLNNSLSDYFNQVEYTKDLQNSLQDSLGNLQQEKNDLIDQKAALESKQKQLQDLKDTQASEKIELQGQQIYKSDLLTQTKNSERKFQALYEQAKKEQQQISAEITALEKTARKKLQANQNLRALTDARLIWPVAQNTITAYFHDPDYPFRYLFEHPAIDIRTKQGTPLKAASDGYILQAHDGGMGYSYIAILHADGLSTVYGHVSRINVQEDQYVSKGEIIGASGAMPGTPGAGRLTTGPHLHFEVRLNGIPVNPLDYLP